MTTKRAPSKAHPSGYSASSSTSEVPLRARSPLSPGTARRRTNRKSIPAFTASIHLGEPPTYLRASFGLSKRSLLVLAGSVFATGGLSMSTIAGWLGQ